MTSCTGSVRGGFWGIWKNSVSWVESCGPKKKGDFRLLAEALWRVPHVLVGCRWKSQNRKNEYLSPYVEEPLNSKVIKSFVPELRSHKCFSSFGIPMFYVYMLWTFYVRYRYSCMAMLHFLFHFSWHIFPRHYYYYNCYSLGTFHTNISWWFLTGLWAT